MKEQLNTLTCVQVCGIIKLYFDYEFNLLVLKHQALNAFGTQEEALMTKTMI